MQRGLNEYFRHLIKSALFWTSAMVLFALVRFYGLSYEIGISISPKFESAYDIYQILFTSAAAGLFLGIIYASIEFVLEHFLPPRTPVVLTIALQLILVALSVLLISLIIPYIYAYLFEFQYPLRSGWWYKDLTYHPIFIYIVAASIVFTSWIVISEKFDKAKLLKILVGHYKNPKEEHRIFMFLDLKSSTTYAEQLGHFKYSQLIQDCFYDLDEVVQQFGAEIYQYIGDEVVLTWNWRKGIQSNRCIEVFFAFEKHINSRASYYQEKYGLIPVFKAGVHGGKLMAAEVGISKKELAYHGDVINTTARIQSLCNEKNALLLVSKKLFDQLSVDRPFNCHSVGTVALKGKDEEVTLCAIYK